jgi:outer membrane protein TolC
MRTAQPLMERLNDWQSQYNDSTATATRTQQVDNTATLQLASHYTRTLIIRSIYRPFCTFNSRYTSRTTASDTTTTEAETEAYTHYRLAAKSAAHRFTDFAREISDRQIRAFWPFCKKPTPLLKC